jgi:hypothetical protein
MVHLRVGFFEIKNSEFNSNSLREFQSLTLWDKSWTKYDLFFKKVEKSREESEFNSVPKQTTWHFHLEQGQVSG